MTLFYYIKWKNLFSDFYEKNFLKFFICWAIISCFSYVHLGYTHGPRYLTTLLVKYFNDYLDIQGCEQGGGWVTCFKVVDVFSYVLDITYANSRQKISLDTSWGMS